jgi:hypothetical protein
MPFDGAKQSHALWLKASKMFPFDSFWDLNEAKAYAVKAAKNTGYIYSLSVLYYDTDKNKPMEMVYTVYPFDTHRKLSSITSDKRWNV